MSPFARACFRSAEPRGGTGRRAPRNPGKGGMPSRPDQVSGTTATPPSAASTERVPVIPPPSLSQASYPPDSPDVNRLCEVTLRRPA
jgi:hypothetical protein